MNVCVVARDTGPRKYFQSLGFASILELSAEEEKVEEYLMVDLVITGTCLGVGIEKNLVYKALERGIPCASIIEHWSWYRKRFETSDRLLLPDKILVNDDIAYNDAISDGLPSERLVALGNPVLEDHALRSIRYVRDTEGARSKHGMPQGSRVIVFVSEELRSEFKPETYDYLGYDEYQVVQQLFSLLGSNDHLVIKLHPAESYDKYAFLRDNRVSVIRRATVEDIAALGDVIVGMDSMLLLELAMYRNDVISFRPGATRSFIGERLGATVGACSTEQLREVMQARVTVESGFRHRFTGSRDRIIRFLEGMAR